MIRTGLAIVFAGVLLAGCGEARWERGVTGAGIGAGTGAATGAIVGGSPARGAAIGGAVGGATGVLTDRDDIDLGDPIWE